MYREATATGLSKTPHSSHPRQGLCGNRLSGVESRGIDGRLTVLMATHLSNLTMGIVCAELHDGLIMGNIHHADVLAQIVEHAFVDVLATIGDISADTIMSVTESVVIAFVSVFTRLFRLVVQVSTIHHTTTRRIIIATITCRFISKLAIISRQITPSKFAAILQALLTLTPSLNRILCLVRIPPLLGQLRIKLLHLIIIIFKHRGIRFIIRVTMVIVFISV
ncbi:uncharacterized protein N7484_009551 [Penicillium longicatenatum]|uniref:uncharacterized protein n=1 Tax=Penicillium longicatenatum TaxID=1561947 RepID=UPI002548C8C5|nr:uncharacterized protein N7484_009551 [Penicillium longicatenatum]KAJ5636238.1 hypothetical protein N7484_009551 [Penicillium longicatenatum]